MKMKFNWGFGIAIVYIFFAGSMVLFAIKASHQKNELVTDQYYDEAVKYQDKINAEKNAFDSQSMLSVKYIKINQEVVVLAEGPAKHLKGSLEFYKPDKAENDFTLSFETDDSGKQLIPVKKLATGLWKVKCSWNAEGKSCYSENKLFITHQ